MSLLKGRWPTFMRFCTVGVGNTLVDFCFFLLFLQIGIPYMLTQFIAYSAGMINSFIWNRTWTFQQKQKVNITEIFRFIMINLFALILTSMSLFILYEILGKSLLVSKGITTIVGILITFIGSRFWVFQAKKEVVS